MSPVALPCGCIVEIQTDKVERIIKLCDCCMAEFNGPGLQRPREWIDEAARRGYTEVDAA